MVLIQSEVIGELWYGKVTHTDAVLKTAIVYFFVPDPSDHRILVRETYGRHARNTVNWKSIVGIARGRWLSTNRWQLED